MVGHGKLRAASPRGDLGNDDRHNKYSDSWLTIMRLCIHYVTVFLYVTVFAFPDLIFTVSNKQVSLSRQWYVTALHGCEFSDANYHLLGYE